MMKKILIGLTLIMPTMNCFADEINDKIEDIHRTIKSLQEEVARLPKPITYFGGEGIDINNNVISVKKERHAIGEIYHGGIIFFLDETGQHGLVASLNDLNQGIQWRNGDSGNKVTNAKADGIGAGETNTRLIVAEQTVDNQNGQFASLLAANYQVLSDGLTPCKTPIAPNQVCYSGWYLPSAFELQLMYDHLYSAGLANFSSESYWSSTEASVASAWQLNFASGELTHSNKSNLGHVRAVSHF